MLPFRFGSPSRQMFGLHHPPASTGASSHAAVLICNPFGQEAVRTHRMFRVLADRLARAGLHVLRFDYYGCGDSAGQDEAGDIVGWRKDVASAHDELTRRSGCSRAIWFGARLGATLAMLAAGDVRSAPARVLLWEPIVSGKRYLEHLKVMHLRAISESYSIAPAALLQGEHEGEALGFGVGPAFRQQLNSLDLAQQVAASATAYTLIAPRGNTEATALATTVRDAGGNMETIDFEHHFDWVSEEALNTSLVPPDVLHLVTSLIEAAR